MGRVSGPPSDTKKENTAPLASRANQQLDHLLYFIWVDLFQDLGSFIKVLNGIIHKICLGIPFPRQNKLLVAIEPR